MADILFVCEGNLCRSAFAERLLEHALSTVPEPRPTVSSAGTHAAVGVVTPAPLLAIMRELRVEPSVHEPSQIDAPVITNAHLVLTASREQRSAVVEAHAPAIQYSYTIRQFERRLRLDACANADDRAVRGSSRDRLEHLVELLPTLRQCTQEQAQDDDVVDPYGREAGVYRQAAAEIIPGVDLLARYLGADGHHWSTGLGATWDPGEADRAGGLRQWTARILRRRQ